MQTKLMQNRCCAIGCFLNNSMGIAWMFCSRSSNNRINHLHERALRIVYNNHSSTFEDLFVKDDSVSIHHRNIGLLAAGLQKAKNNLFSQIMLELF